MGTSGLSRAASPPTQAGYRTDEEDIATELKILGQNIIPTNKK